MYRTQIDIYPYRTYIYIYICTYILNAYAMYAAVYCMISIYNRRYIHPYINIYLRYTHNIHTCTRNMSVQADTYVSVFECVYPTIVQWNSEANENYNKNENQHQKEKEENKKREENKIKQKRKQMHIF